MKDKLQVWALIAEIVSGVAIVITLIFLVVSVRDETRATRTLVYEDLLSGLNEFYNVLMQDEELASLWLAGRELGSVDLSDEEVRKLTLMFRNVMRILDAGFSASQYGTLGEPEGDRILASACNTYEILETVNARVEPDIFVPISPRFREFLANSCSV